MGTSTPSLLDRTSNSTMYVAYALVGTPCYVLFLPSTTSMAAIPTREGMTPEAAALTAIAPPMLHRVLENTVNMH